MNSTRDREDTRNPSRLMFRPFASRVHSSHEGSNARDPIWRRARLGQKEETRNEIVDSGRGKLNLRALGESAIANRRARLALNLARQVESD